MSFDWKKLVGTVAPTLATVLTGGNPLAGMAISALSTALLGKPDGTEEELNTFMVSATPADLIKMKETDNAFKLAMEEAGVKLEETHAKDRASARLMAAATGLFPQISIAIIFIAGFVTLLWAIFTGTAEIAPEMADLAKILLGIMVAGIGQIMNFFFGSSSGSKQKTAGILKK